MRFALPMSRSVRSPAQALFQTGPTSILKGARVRSFASPLSPSCSSVAAGDAPVPPAGGARALSASRPASSADGGKVPSAPLSAPNSPVGSGGRTFADVVAFEDGLHGAFPQANSYGPSLVSPVSALKPIRVPLDPKSVEDIFQTVEDLSSFAAIFRFRGYWPSLADLHDWISKKWLPLIHYNVHIFPCAKGFFIAKFQDSNDRKIILCHNNFSWQGRFPLMAKPWHMDFDPLSESFNKYPIWVRLPNLPIHLWQDSDF